MDVHARTGGDRAVRRIITLLLSFAVLAERAAARSWPVRCFVLFLLRRGEGVVADYVLDATGMPAPVIDGMATVGYSPDAAMLLAVRFRLLAAALGALLVPAGLSPCRSASAASALRRFELRLGWLAVILGVWMPEAYDTS